VTKIRQDKFRFAKRYGKRVRSSSISDKPPAIRELMEVWLMQAGYKVTRQFGHAKLLPEGVSMHLLSSVLSAHVLTVYTL
jgi:hypothetical protein